MIEGPVYGMFDVVLVLVVVIVVVVIVVVCVVIVVVGVVIIVVVDIGICVVNVVNLDSIGVSDVAKDTAVPNILVVVVKFISVLDMLGLTILYFSKMWLLLRK
jgi:hypothetical protein